MNQMTRDELMAENRYTPNDGRAFRDALGQFATGVTVITTITDEGPVGMTANSFSSVSLDPALVLWCIGNNAARYDVFTAAERFAISVCSDQQAMLAKTFAKDGNAFTSENSVISGGLPVLRDALSVFECDTHAIHEGGDHKIIVGRVTHVTLGSGAPVVFHQGKFGGFTPS
ncbi:flavin reductase family protein [Roseobacteraceae bacterium S113]